jgi:hypothetical protein
VAYTATPTTFTIFASDDNADGGVVFEVILTYTKM